MEATLLDLLRAQLPALSDKLGLERVARESGVPYHTLLKIVSGETEDPRVSTVDNLLAYFRKQAA